MPDVAPAQIQKIVNRASLDGEGAVHISLAQIEFGAYGELGVQGLVVEANRHFGTFAAGDPMDSAGGVRYDERAFADDTLK